MVSPVTMLLPFALQIIRSMMRNKSH